MKRREAPLGHTDLDPDQCWEAVANRDQGSDGEFVYGVRQV